MNSLSVVIITYNEEHNIVNCIRSAQLVSDDIIVVDTYSNDRTVSLAVASGARVFPTTWKGYGFSRNLGAMNAKNDWILALDADERITESLAHSISRLNFSAANYIYHFRRENYLGRKKIRFGTLGFETVKRIYNRNHSRWDLTLVHERLESLHPSKKLIRGYIEHFGLKSEEDYKAKAILYAQMSAEKYFTQGKGTNLLKGYVSALFNSAKSYIFLFGFLDGRAGWISAKTIAYYSWLKCIYLHQFRNGSKIKEINIAATKSHIKRA
jgi:glycosyltransferase involved in cell wall biosynthesis